MRIALEPGTEVSRYSVSFTEPYFRDKPITLDTVASSFEREREAYDEERTKGYVGFRKREKQKFFKSLAFRLEDVDVAGIDVDAPTEITDDKGSNIIAGVRVGFGRDLTDSRFNPTKGSNYEVNYEQVGGDHTFGVLGSTVRWYKTLKEDLARRKTVLETKVHAAAIVGDAPVFEKFYAGGIGSIRGFDYRGVSTRGVNPLNPAVKNDPIGSDWIATANTEVSIPMVGETLAGLVFADAGIIDSGGPRASIGIGVQVMVPQFFGPVPMRFELAAPILKNGDDETQVFSFSVGRLF